MPVVQNFRNDHDGHDLKRASLDGGTAGTSLQTGLLTESRDGPEGLKSLDLWGRATPTWTSRLWTSHSAATASYFLAFWLLLVLFATPHLRCFKAATATTPATAPHSNS